jgi:uncharacterized protein (DUF362 family)
MPVVAISHTKEKHLSPERVLGLVREAIGLLGGMSRFVQPGQTVLIKPNVTVFYSAAEGVTTEPLVVAALIRQAYEAGAAHVQVGESSGDAFDSLTAMRITGIAAVAEKEGAEVIDLGDPELPNRVVPVPGGRVIQEVPLPAPLLDADVIINACKAKNHHMDPITGALKNWVGVVSREWREYNHGDHDMFGRFMDIMTVSRPALNVVDALIAGEGDGPIANLPRWCGCILASPDPVATDVSIARLMGHDPEKITFAKVAQERGLGVMDPIEYVGAPLADVAFQAWPGHKGFDYLPLNWLVGEGVTVPGTVGHLKSVLDSMHRRGDLWEVMWLVGTPTIMVGAIEDPNFEEHLREGPYVVVDDAALAKYKDDPRVHFIPGHPVLRDGMPELLKALGVSRPGNAIMRWQQFQRWGMNNLTYGTPWRRAATAAKPLGVLLAAACAAALWKKLR